MSADAGPSRRPPSPSRGEIRILGVPFSYEVAAQLIPVYQTAEGRIVGVRDVIDVVAELREP